MLTFFAILIVLIALANISLFDKRNPNNAITLTLNNNGVYDVDECLLWAFGEGYGSEPLYTLNDRWNKLHSDLFMIYGSDNFIKSFERIGKAYKEMKQNEH